MASSLVQALCLAFVFAIGFHATVVPSRADESPGPLAESQQERDQRMQWWRDARFGMFIHWGVYAVPAGEWNGQQVPGIGEWIMSRAAIPRSEYKPLAARFDPQQYDPAEWAQIAADAGMKYLVITSKHHDGFCLFDTNETDWDVVDATPYGKDLLRPLAEECRKRGVRFCTYYSIMDWTHPSQEIDAERPHDTIIDPSQKAEYVAYMKRQLQELLDSCDPDVLWFDGEWVPWWTEQDGQDLERYLRGIKPSLIINNRVGKGRKGMEGLSRGDRKYAGDFGTPEQQIPATGLPGVDWESCMTMNDTWGFKKHDDNWKSEETLIRNLIDIVSKGGNFLLNVGPMANGRIPEPSVDRLAAMGNWLDQHGEAIYGCVASPIGRPDWGRCTAKPHGATPTLYLHVFDWPQNAQLSVDGINTLPVKASLLGGNEQLTVEKTGSGLVIALPEEPASPYASVIKLEFDTPIDGQDD